MKQNILSIIRYFLLLVLFFLILYFFYYFYMNKSQDTVNFDYKNTLENDKNKRIFPFRYFQDKNNQILPFVAICGFFRDEEARQKYIEYKRNGIHIFGITAYKTFPKKIMDGTGDGDTKNDTFDYLGNIKNWLCCFYHPNEYGFTNQHNILNMSESDFYNAEEEKEYEVNVSKKYDFIYSCLKDDDHCPLDGWNAVNRNFRLARECFKIMVNEYGLKGLVVGRIGCGLEEEFGGKIEVTDMLEFNVFQDKLRESRFLFVPNIYDASPRVIAEALIKNVPILMNRHIVCGSKYINHETGEFFNDEYDIRYSLDSLFAKIEKISPRKWWKKNYSTDKMERKLRDFLNNAFPNTNALDYVSHIKFVL